MEPELKGEIAFGALGSHQIFNMLNNLFPLKFVDMRAVDDFTNCRLRQSCHIDLEDVNSAIAELDDLVAKQNGSFGLIFVYDSADALPQIHTLKNYASTAFSRAASNSDGRNTLGWHRLEYLSILNFNEFHEKYKDCETVFIRGQMDKDLRFKGSIRYFASEIIPNFLFLGDYQNATELSQLKALKISHIVDATGCRLSKESAEALSITYLPVDVWDCETANIAEFFDGVNDFIKSARDSGGRVLVHCRAGISRSTSLVIAFLMYSSICSSPPVSLENAFTTVIYERPIICPNSSFREQLISFEHKLFGQNSLGHEREILNLIQTKSKLYSGSHALETDIDRMPIQALVNKDTKWSWENAFPDATEASADTDAANTSKSSGKLLPKKPFLRRNKERIVDQPAIAPKSDIVPDSSSSLSAPNRSNSRTVAKKRFIGVVKQPPEEEQQQPDENVLAVSKQSGEAKDENAC